MPKFRRFGLKSINLIYLFIYLFIYTLFYVDICNKKHKNIVIYTTQYIQIAI